jgi:hypothetical protein
MTQTITNGTGRKSLAGEIDRLQATVAGLGDEPVHAHHPLWMHAFSPACFATRR